MSGTCGPMSGMPLAQYDPEQQCWKTCEDTSLWALTLSSLTLPTWGFLHAGVLYEHLMPEHHTIERDYSSLPTPAVNDMGAGKDPQAWNEWAARQKAADGRPAPHGKSLEQEALKMLGTPTASMTHRSRRGIRKVPNPREIAAMVDKGIPIGANTSLLFSDGKPSLDAARQPPLFGEASEIA